MDLETLARRVGEQLRAQQLTLAVAESCTGGALSDAITDIAGSSDYFLGGIIAYANEAKQRLLVVPAQVLQTHGAVSPQVAEAMAEGARRLLDADLAVAITGIAGPTGGTPDKPVGLVYIALAGEGGTRVECYRWSGSRRENKEASVRAALELVLQY